MKAKTLKVLKDIFGYNSFLKGQEEIITHTSAGGDSLVLMPTGGGKSLCYQIPSIVRSGTGVVISPLISLMRDQVSALKQAGVRASYLNSTLSVSETSNVEEDFLSGTLDLLYVAPERLLTKSFLSMLKRVRIALFAIDEAHCVSRWGHDFRKDYLALNILHESFPNVPRIALTATADIETRDEIRERLALNDAELFVTDFDRPNIRYTITEKAGAKDRLNAFINTQHSGEAGIIYCMSRKRVEENARWFSERGHTALPYHAGLPSELRAFNQDRFLNEEGIIITATIAFGMGIDKSNVRFVAHLDMPRSIEGYYQETGRAGRDCLPSDAWMSYGLKDIILQKKMIEGSSAPAQRKRVERAKLDAMLGFVESPRCRRELLLRYFGQVYNGPCGNCDNCLNPVESFDASIEAQMALSCVYRTGQRFGVAYLTDILTGKTNDRITSLGHDKISTFGIGSARDPFLWRSVYRQLLAGGVTELDADGYNTIRLTEKARPILSGAEKLFLRKEVKPLKKRRTKKGVRPVKALEPASPEARLFEELKEHRLTLARTQGVAPYVIFHDSTLMEFATIRPGGLDSMLEVTGVGLKKLKKYGPEFLEIIKKI